MTTSELLDAIGLRDGVLAVLVRAALDASSCHPDWVYAVAGYVAPTEDWDAIMPHWRDATAYWQIPRFHLTDLPNWMGHERAALCEKYFSNIVKASNLHSIGSAILTEDWQKPDWKGDKSPRFATPYEQSFWFALKVLGNHCEKRFPGQGVAVLCDIDAPEPAMNAVFKQSQAVNPNLHSLTVSDNIRTPELQCADLAAGLLRRSWVDITTREDCDLPWGNIPRSKNGSTSVWSLRQGALLHRAFKLHKKRGK